MGWDGVPLREWKWETLKFLINLQIKFLFVCTHQQKTANDIFQKLSLLYKFQCDLLTPDTMPHVSLHILLVTQCAFDFSVYLPNAINLFSNNIWGPEVRGERSGLYSNNNSIFQFVWFLFGCAYLFAVCTAFKCLLCVAFQLSFRICIQHSGLKSFLANFLVE